MAFFHPTASQTQHFTLKEFVDPSKNSAANQGQCLKDFKRDFHLIYVNGKPLSQVLENRGYPINQDTGFTETHLNVLWNYLTRRILNNTTQQPVLVNYLNRYLHQGGLLNSLQTAMIEAARRTDLTLPNSGIERYFNIITEPGALLLVEEIAIKEAWLESKDGELLEQIGNKESNLYLSQASIVHRLSFPNGAIEPEHTIVDIKLQNYHPCTYQAFDKRTLWEKILGFLQSLFEKDLREPVREPVSLIAYRQLNP